MDSAGQYHRAYCQTCGADLDALLFEKEAQHERDKAEIGRLRDILGARQYLLGECLGLIEKIREAWAEDYPEEARRALSDSRDVVVLGPGGAGGDTRIGPPYPGPINLSASNGAENHEEER